MREILRVTLQCSGYAASLGRHLQPAGEEEKGKAMEEEETKTEELWRRYGHDKDEKEIKGQEKEGGGGRGKEGGGRGGRAQKRREREEKARKGR